MATRYWVGGAGNWSSTTKWSTSSGGASGASVPISTDDVVFDANSGLVAAVATVDTAQTCATLTLTPGATIGFSTIALTASLTVTGLFSMSGTAGNQRFLIRGNTYGLAIDFSVGSASSLSDLDFRDVRVIGAASPLSGTRIGNLRGVTGVTFSTAKTVYWNLAGAQNWSANGWAATSGGTPATANFPLAQDTATFDNTGSVTGTITMDAAIPYAGSVDMSSRSSAMTLATTAFTIYGDWKNGSGTTLSGATTLIFSGRNTQSITSASKTFTQAITIDTYGGTVQLVDALNVGANTLTVTNGTFTTNGNNVTAGIFSSTNSNVRAINLGASTIALSSNFTLTNAINLIFNAGSSTINLSSTTAVTFNGGGLSFNNVNFTGTTAVTHAINGANTFANLTFTAPAATGLMQCTFFSNQTITGTLTCAGASVIRRIFLRPDTIGTQRTLTCAAVSGQDSDFRDIAIAGAAAPYNAFTLRVGDCGGNSGITFPTAKTVYWNLAGAQNWSATGWATTSGGTPAANNFPLVQDTATFNTASGTIGTITIDAAWNIGTVDMTGRVVTTFPMTLTTSTNTPTIYGSWLFDTGVSSSSTTGTITFGGRGTQTITNRGITFNCPITIDSSTGTVQLADALTLASTRALLVNSGTFDSIAYNVTAGLFTLTAGTLKMGSGTWTLSGTGSVWTYTAGTFYKGTANIVLSDTSTTARSFDGGGLSYNKLTIGGTTGISTLTFTGNNQFTELASTKTVAHTIAFGSTSQTFGAWSVTGTSGNVVTVTGTATLTIAGARVSGVDYLALGTTTISATSPGEFYAGANSTGGTNAILTAAPTAVTRYWRGGTGTWDASTTTNWSATSGGSGGASVPTSADAVIFDTLSNATAYTVTCTATQLRCAALTMGGPATGNVTWAGTGPLAIHGNVSLAASGITNSYTGNITLSGSATGKTFTVNGNSPASPTEINGVGCGWTLGSALSIGNILTVTNGSISLSTFNLTCSTISSVNGNTRSIDLGSSTVAIFSTGITFSSVAADASNLTFTAGTSQINLAAGSLTITGGGKTFNNVSITGTGAGNYTFNNANTFANLTFAGRATAGLGTAIFAADQTITGTLTFSAGTDATMRTFVRSDVLGTTRTLTVNAFAAGATDLDFRDITIAGAAAPISGTRFGDCKGNTGITFGTGVSKYWNLVAGGNWSAIGWATTSGGTPAVNNFPLAQDTAIFQSTGLNSGATVTVNAGYNIGTIDMSSRTTNTMVLAFSAGITIHGNWINGTGTALTGAATLTFAGRGSQTITSAGSVFAQAISIYAFGGSVTLTDAFATSYATLATLTINAGTFNAASYSVTLSGASSGITSLSGSTSNFKTINFGSGTWTIAGTNGFNLASNTNLTISGSGTVKLSSASTKTFAGGGFSYSGITIDQAGAGQLNITGNNTFANITNTYSATGAATINFAATFTTVSQFTAAGAASKLLTLTGTSAAAPATLIYSGSGNVSSNYLTINNVKAYPTTLTWYAGTNSTNGGNLGWIFTAPPGGAYTIAALNGSYTLNGQSVGIARNRNLTSSYGAYAVNGQTINIYHDRSLTSSYGTYTQTGQSAGLYLGRSLNGSYGTYTQTGQSAGLYRGRSLAGSYGTYAQTGQSAGLYRSRSLAGSYGTYAQTGQSAGLYFGRNLIGSYGSYSLTGQDAILIHTSGTIYNITATAGNYTLNGQSIGLYRNRSLTSSYGTYALDGQSAKIYRNRILGADFGSYALIGSDATVVFGRVLLGSPGNYTVAGEPATILKTSLLLPDSGLYSLSGQAVNITYSGEPIVESVQYLIEIRSFTERRRI
jgi:fibronectin-binding autotransporter adhesin